MGAAGATSRLNSLVRLAPIYILCFIAIRYQSQLVAWHHEGLGYGTAFVNVTSPPRVQIQNVTSHVAPHAFLLQRSDSIYREYNSSVTPIVIEKYKLLLFTIEKTGSTVLKQLMRRMMGYEDYYVHDGRGMPHVWPKNGLKDLTHYGLSEANKMLTSDEWTRAIFVRDPKERVLSGYREYAYEKFAGDQHCCLLIRCTYSSICYLNAP